LAVTTNTDFYQTICPAKFSANDINPYLPDSSIAKLKKDLEGYRYGKMFLPPGRNPPLNCPALTVVLNGAALLMIRKQVCFM
jgi:hypothetical protein